MKREEKKTRITNERIMEILRLPNGSEILEKEYDALPQTLELLLKEKDAEDITASALSFLVRACKKKRELTLVTQKIGDRELARYLSSEDSKVRKNAARLAGAMKKESLCSELAKALQQESSLMAIPSMILALGNLGTPEAGEALRDYMVPKAKEPSEEKHIRAIEEALRKALAGSYKGGRPHRFTDLQGEGGKPLKLVLTCAKGMEKGVVKEIRERKAAEDIYTDPLRATGRVEVRGTSWEKISKVRSVREILIPLSSKPLNVTKDAGKLAMLVSGAMDRMHEGGAPYRFRVEAGQTRGHFSVSGIAAGIESASEGKLINAPSGYECELRLHFMGKEDAKMGPGGMAFPYLKLFTVKDARFAYRKKPISASIHPANAAALMWMVEEELGRSKVMDPCCGSGTLLSERAYLAEVLTEKRPKGLLGVDIASSAMEAASENAKEVTKELHLSAYQLLHKDMTKLSLKEPVDEIFANLPFGSRVGTHENNKGLYESLAGKLSSWLRKDGTAVLYTMEGKLLKDEIRKNNDLKVIRSFRLEAGGLEPVVMVVKRK